MFHYQTLSIETNEHVYNPAEDTFFLLENIKITENESILELGTGCGIIALICAYHGAHVICTDVNPYAIDLTNKNKIKNRKKLHDSITIVQGDLFSPFKPLQQFDTIIFNPPYLPTNISEKVPGWINQAFDGGKDGLRTITQFIQQCKPFLTHQGTAYFIKSSLNNTKKLQKTITQSQLAFIILKTLKMDNEILEIYQLSQ